jgi:protoheme IX farnesyltransferase
MNEPISQTAHETLWRRFRLASWLILALIAAQIVLGSTVRATGAGMGCPDWPLCHGSWLPAWNFESVLEYSHRLVGALVSLSLLGAVAAIALSRPLRRQLGRLAATLVYLLVVLVSFGAVTVAYDMPPAVVACHLELATLLLMTWVVILNRSREALMPQARALPIAGVYRYVAWVALGAGLIQLFLGALVSVSHAGLACPDFPTCYGMWWPPLVGNVGIQMIHRYGAYTLAVIVAVLVALCEWRASVDVRLWSRVCAALLVIQVSLGIGNVLMKHPAWLSVSHLACGVSLVLGLFMVAYSGWPQLWYDRRQTQEGGDVATLGKSERIRAFVQLTKPTIVMLVVVTGLPALIMAGQGQVDAIRWLAALVGTALAASSAAVFNQYFERERDKQMTRTRMRPLPSGRVQPNEALAFALVLGVTATVLLLFYTTSLAVFLALFSLFFYGFYYTLVLKDRSHQNIVIGGAAGASAPLICWAAVTGTVGLPAWIMFLIIFLWTPPHFWALAIYRLDDYRESRFPMYPVVRGVAATTRSMAIYTLVMVPLSLVLYPIGAAGPLYLTIAALLGAGFIWLTRAVLRTQSHRDAMRLFAYSIVYTLALFSGMTLDAIVGVHHSGIEWNLVLR